ncbi:type II secretion system F family protein [Cytobacillus suaedae]|nr:type II secretion system F family protein [Cytobacillus suaedae]
MTKNKWKPQEQVVFLKRLGELLDHGYSLTQGIEFLQLQMSEKCRRDLQIGLQKLKEGDSFYSILTDLKFHKDVLAYLFFAQKQGDISFALREGSLILARRIEHIAKLKKMISYPLFLIFFVCCIVIVLVKILLPQFVGLYHSMNLDTSFFISILLNFSNLSKIVFYVVLVFLVLSLLLYFLYFTRLSAIKKMRLIVKVPFINKWIRLLNSHFFSVQLSNLLKGGLSIYEAIRSFEEQKHSEFFREEAIEIKSLLTSGERLDHIISTRTYFDQELAQIIKHGQSHGNLDQELYHYSHYTLEQLDSKIATFLKVSQPLLFTSIGLIIVSMYMAIMLPMFKLINSI